MQPLGKFLIPVQQIADHCVTLRGYALVLITSDSIQWTYRWKFRPYANNPYTLIDEDDMDNDDIESGINGGETHGLQTMSRREGRGGERDE